MFCLFAGSSWACVYAKANSKNRVPLRGSTTQGYGIGYGYR